MRKIIALICAVLLVFSLSSCKKDYKYGEYKITMTETLIYNDSVGEEWLKSYTYNDANFTSGDTIIAELYLEKIVDFMVIIVEDDNFDDVKTKFFRVILKDGYTTTFTLYVTENMGKYSGNKAKWEITCKVELVDKF